MFKNLTKKLMAFGQKDELYLSEDEKDGINTLVTMFPELWLPLKKVIYSRMNAYSRKLVTASGEEMIKIQSKIIELDDLIKAIVEIKPDFRNNKKAKKELQNMSRTNNTETIKSQDNINVLNYIKSNDVRDSNGKIRLSA